jgi:hypothetical protein
VQAPRSVRVNGDLSLIANAKRTGAKSTHLLGDIRVNTPTIFVLAIGFGRILHLRKWRDKVEPGLGA